MLESAPALRAQAAAEEKAKLEALERTLGISDADAGPSGKRAAEVDVGELARKKHRFEDTEFLEESREIKDNVRSAVAAGECGFWPMVGLRITYWTPKSLVEIGAYRDNKADSVVGLLKKKKKPKTDSTIPSGNSATKTAPTIASKAARDKAAMPPPAAPKVAPVAATAA